jgi:hypothetical protein
MPTAIESRAAIAVALPASAWAWIEESRHIEGKTIFKKTSKIGQQELTEAAVICDDIPRKRTCSTTELSSNGRGASGAKLPCVEPMLVLDFVSTST